MKRSAATLILLFAVFLASFPVCADVAPDPLYKGMTPARKDSRVQMRLATLPVKVNINSPV